MVFIKGVILCNTFILGGLIMSRSYRKFPIIRYEKEDYHMLNRLFRRKRKNLSFEVGQYGNYRKVLQKWNTWASSQSLKHFVQRRYYEMLPIYDEDFYDSYDETVNKYYKYYIRK